jgi:hypothetical protein
VRGVFILENNLVNTNQFFEQFQDSSGAIDLSKLLRSFLSEETVKQVEEYIRKGSLI